MAIIKENKPELYILKRKLLQEGLDQEFGHSTTAKHTKFNINFQDVWDLKTHLFIGPTGIGKTNYALSHFKAPVHITNLQNFSRISENPDLSENISKYQMHRKNP